MWKSEMIRGARLMVLGATIVLVVTACTSSSSSSAEASSAASSTPSTAASSAASTAPSAEASTSSKLRLGLVLPDLTNQTINDIYLGAQARAAELGNVDIVEGGTSETGPWLDACQRIVNSGIDVLAYDTLDAVATSTCIKQANTLSIKTICLFACTSEGTNDALITLDFHEVGLMGGTWMGTALSAKGGGEVGFLEGPPGDEAIQAVQTGFREALQKSCPDCKLVAEVPGGHDRNTGYTAAQQVLTAHPNINGIAGANDDVAMGIVRAVQQVDKIGDILITGNNGTCEALGSILKGDLSETVLVAGQPFGASTVDAAIKLLASETVPTVNVTPAQVDQALGQGIMDGSKPDVASVSLKDRLVKAQNGCK